jgi:phosphohistidine phosphatase
MNDIILWRHAEAEPSKPDEPDAARELTAKGHRQAQKMAAWLDRQLPANCKILCSPSLRTLQTVKPLGRKYRECDALLPDAEVQAALALCRSSDRGEAVLLVGHQPMLGTLASLLLTGMDQPWTVRKGAVVWLAPRKEKEDKEKGNALYLKVVLPAELAGK